MAAEKGKNLPDLQEAEAFFERNTLTEGKEDDGQMFVNESSTVVLVLSYKFFLHIRSHVTSNVTWFMDLESKQTSCYETDFS